MGGAAQSSKGPTRRTQKGRPGSPAIGQHNDTILGLTLSQSYLKSQTKTDSFLYLTRGFLL